jgi:NADH:ubiquinone oxidoreductase subunit 6 (subunit J)
MVDLVNFINKICYNYSFPTPIFLTKSIYGFIFYNTNLIYYFFIFIIGLLFILIALSLILSDSSVHSIMCLMFLFLLLTIVSIINSMEFLALIFIIVYIGAVCVLMLFHIKLIKTFVHRFDNIRSKDIFLPFLSISFFLPLFNIILLFVYKEYNFIFLDSDDFVQNYDFGLTNNSLYGSSNIFGFNMSRWFLLLNSINSTYVLGFLLYTVYFMLLLYGALVLLIAMIGSIYLTLVNKKAKKFQYVRKQIFSKINSTLI